jgi:ligand-binding sensor domain-containing protein/two-component sensor histidine kinase
VLRDYGRDVWQREQGLPSNTIRSILQTSDGYLWLATDEGLVRFDGIRFRTFDTRNTPELKSNEIQVLFEAKDQSLWIGTGAGAARVRDGRFVAFDSAAFGSPDGPSSDRVSSIVEDKDGQIWIATTSGLRTYVQGTAGIRAYAEGTIRSYSTSDGLPSDSINSIYEDRSGALWVSTAAGLARFGGKDRIEQFTTANGLPHDNVKSVFEDRAGSLWVNTLGGLARLSNNKFEIYSAANGLLSDRVWSIHEDRNGDLWFGTDGGLNRYSNGALSSYTTTEGLPDNTVWSVHEDRAGVLWMATPGGLARLSDGKIAPYTTRDGLSDDVILSLFDDREGSLWIGTESGGLNRLKDAKFTTLAARDGLASDFVWSVLQGADGSLWAGTNGGGLSRVQNGRVTSYTTQDGLASNIVRALCEDTNGSLWIGTPGGLNRMTRAGRIETFRVEDGLSSNAVLAVEEDREGGIWIATLGGLTRFKDGKFRVYTGRDGLSDDAVTSLCASRDGGLWIGTRSGALNKLDGARVVSYRSDRWTTDDSVRAIYEDPDGVVWVGTRRSGLSRFQDGRFTTWTSREGLFDDTVYQIIEDANQNLWMSSPRGVFRVSKPDLLPAHSAGTRVIDSVPYGTADGMLSRECSGGQPAGWKSRDGKLWFPTARGVAMIDPLNMPLNTVVPPVVIERAMVDGQPVETGAKVELPPGKERYEFHYTALSLVAPEKVRFKYQLSGYDEDWIDAGTERIAPYTHVPPGNYTFRVKACNNDGVWNEEGAAFSLYLRPHFYQTWWFYAACIGLAGLLGFAVYRLRVRRIKSEFSAVLEERNRMAREIHDTLAQGFVGIALQLQAVEKSLPESPDTANKHLTLARSMVSHSLAEARRTVWDLRSQALESGDLAKALSETATRMTQDAAVQAEVRITGQPRRLPPQIENNTLRIAQEALTNALKHAGASRVMIDLGFEQNGLTLKVADDGCGFDTKQVLGVVDGHFGLRGMRERVEHMGGELFVTSSPGEGTEVIARVPIK